MPPSVEEEKVGNPARPRWIPGWRRLFDFLSWGVLLFLAFHLLFRETGGPKTGSAAPIHTLVELDSRQALTFPQPEGQRPILIKAFASWCGACRRSVWIDDLSDLGENPQLDFVAVSVDEQIESAVRVKKEWPINATVYFDADSEFSRDYDIQVLPTYILLDKDRRVIRVTTGLPGPLDIRTWKQAARGEL